MTLQPKRIQELRDKMATLCMGWEEGSPASNPDYKYWGRQHPIGFEFVIPQEDFRPDRPNGQIEMLVDRMVELGWTYLLWWDEDTKEHGARFYKPELKDIGGLAYDPDNRRIAIMLAIEVALESEGK